MWWGSRLSPTPSTWQPNNRPHWLTSPLPSKPPTRHMPPLRPLKLLDPEATAVLVPAAAAAATTAEVPAEARAAATVEAPLVHALCPSCAVATEFANSKEIKWRITWSAQMMILSRRHGNVDRFRRLPHSPIIWSTLIFLIFSNIALLISWWPQTLIHNPTLIVCFDSQK
jgi:hypothetical protein